MRAASPFALGIVIGGCAFSSSFSPRLMTRTHPSHHRPGVVDNGETTRTTTRMYEQRASTTTDNFSNGEFVDKQSDLPPKPNFLDCAPNGDQESAKTQLPATGTRMQALTTTSTTSTTSTPTLSVPTTHQDEARDETQVFADLIATIVTTDDQRKLYSSMLNLEDLLLENPGEGQRKQHKQQVFLRMGGPLAVVTTMLKYPHNMALQEWGLVMLTNAAHNNPDVQQVAVHVGAVRAILDAMATHPSSRSIQVAALCALFHLLPATAASTKTTLRVTNIMLDTAIPRIAQTIKTFVNDEELVLLASQLLDYLSRHCGGSQQPLIDGQVIGTLSTILQRHRPNKEIRKFAGRAMIRLVVL